MPRKKLTKPARGSGKRSTNKKQREKMKSDPLMQSMRKAAKAMQHLAGRAEREYTPVVDNILSTKCRDSRYIEHTLDDLLDFCFDPKALLLYKKLCRYYFDLNPTATASYVYAYREMWD